MPGFGKLAFSIRRPFFTLAAAATCGRPHRNRHPDRPDAILTHLDPQRTAHISMILDLAIQAQKTLRRDDLFRSA
jgi:hypothetical protein